MDGLHLFVRLANRRSGLRELNENLTGRPATTGFPGERTITCAARLQGRLREGLMP